MIPFGGLPLHDLNEQMRGKPGTFVLTVRKPNGTRWVLRRANSPTDILPGILSSTWEPEIRYVGELTPNLLDPIHA